MDPYQSLANGIIVQAAEEYLFALRKLKRNPKHKKAADKRTSTESMGQAGSPMDADGKVGQMCICSI